MAFQPLLEAIIELINAMPDEPECVDDHPRWIQYSDRISLRRLAWELVPTAGGRFRTQRSFSISSVQAFSQGSRISRAISAFFSVTLS